MSNVSMSKNYYWSLRYRVPIFLSTLLVGLVASYFKSVFYLLPIVGIFIYCLPMILNFHQIKSPFIVKVTKFFLILFNLSTCMFSYIFLSDVIREQEFSKPFYKFKTLIILMPLIYLMLFGLALPPGMIWEKILKLDSVHCRILLNQFSLPAAALIIGMEGSISSLIITVVIIVYWLMHILKLAMDARKRGTIFPKYLYEYERLRMDDPKRFSELQDGSRRLKVIILLVPLICSFIFIRLMNDELLDASMAVFLLGALGYRLFIKH